MKVRPLYALLLFAPATFLAELFHASPIVIFGLSALAIIPLAGVMGEATEHLTVRTGPGIGGLLNASFGNAAELIIAIMALHKGLLDVVKASITGSIIGNILLVLGAAIVAGGIKHERQVFNRTAASLGATLVALSAIALVIPSIVHQSIASNPNALPIERNLSLDIAIVLFIAYILSLVFALKTHKHLYDGSGEAGEEHSEEHWSMNKSIGILLTATIGTALMAEALTGAVEQAAHTLGMTDLFIGVIVVAVVGNAAEHSTAIVVAMKNKMDLAVNIAVGSSIQIALFVAPLLVFAGYLFGQPMNLIFSPIEVIAIVMSAGVLYMITQDGESNWMEGVMCLAVYIILGIAFFFLP
jgi:Ca2+:H+ antiporter